MGGAKAGSGRGESLAGDPVVLWSFPGGFHVLKARLAASSAGDGAPAHTESWRRDENA